MKQTDRPSKLEQPRILVADADSEAAGRIADYLSRQGFQASHTSRGEDVLRLARVGSFGLAIVDVALRDMSGFMLVSRLREIDPRIHVLMTTADHRPELERRARRVGILYYAPKPVDPRRLAAVAAKAMGAGGGCAQSQSRPGTPACAREVR